MTDIFAQPSADVCITTMPPEVSNVVRYSLNELCGHPNMIGEALHEHLFHGGGIDDAGDALKGKLDSEYFGLGYSAGGTALWRAAAQGLPLAGLFCISSTRLRDEAAISIPNHVFFGALDRGIPSPEWLSETPQQHTVFKNADHTYYLNCKSAEAEETSQIVAEKMMSHLRK